MKQIIAVALVVVAVAVTGCTKQDDGQVLAKVNRSAITAGEFKDQLDSLAPQMQMAVASDEKARREFLDDLIGIELVLQEAKRRGLDKDPEFKKRQAAMKKEMERKIQDSARDDLFNTLLKKELTESLQQPTDAEVKEYFTKNRAEIERATGIKKITLQQAEARGLKNYIFQMKQRDAYLSFAKGLKDKAKITIDDKALAALGKSLAAPQGETGGLQLMPQEAPAAADSKADKSK